MKILKVMAFFQRIKLRSFDVTKIFQWSYNSEEKIKKVVLNFPFTNTTKRGKTLANMQDIIKVYLKLLTTEINDHSRK